MESNSVKIEVPAKPLLSPTRSVDEGFESDPDRVSTDSEVQLANTQQQQFDILQRTDRDGVTHTQIARRFQCDSFTTTSSSVATNSSSQSHSAATATGVSATSNANAAKISLICVTDEIDSGINDNCSPTATNAPPQKPERTRRCKTKAPAPPPSNARSHSVDSIRLNANKNELVLREIDTETINGDVLSGKFVRVQVDPNQTYYPFNQRLHKTTSSSLYSIYPNSGSSSLQLWPASSSNHIRAVNKQKQYSPHHQLFKPSNVCNAAISSNSRHHINRISHPVPVCWTQSIPRQTRR